MLTSTHFCVVTFAARHARDPTPPWKHTSTAKSCSDIQILIGHSLDSIGPPVESDLGDDEVEEEAEMEEKEVEEEEVEEEEEAETSSFLPSERDSGQMGCRGPKQGKIVRGLPVV